MQLDDQSFILLAERNPDKAFLFLVDQYSDMVFSVCLNLVLQREDAEDLTQEVFTSAYTSLASFQGNSKVSTWLYSIALNKSKEFLRNKTRQKRSGYHVQVDGEQMQWLHSGLVELDHPGVQLENKERAAIYFTALEQLPSAQREAWILHKTEGLSYTEVAEIMETTVSSVESLMFRARKGLQNLLRDFYEKNRT